MFNKGYRSYLWSWLLSFHLSLPLCKILQPELTMAWDRVLRMSRKGWRTPKRELERENEKERWWRNYDVTHAGGRFHPHVLILGTPIYPPPLSPASFLPTTQKVFQLSLLPVPPFFSPRRALKIGFSRDEQEWFTWSFWKVKVTHESPLGYNLERHLGNY